MGIIMETEIWPNLLTQCAAANIPLFMANARLSAQSQKGYLKIHSLISKVLSTLKGCYAQTQDDAMRLRSIGAVNIQVCGNTKYDITPSHEMHTLAQQFKQRIGNRPVVVCASTRQYKEQDEATLLLQAWQQHSFPDALLIIVPRHPERFALTVNIASNMGFKVQKRSDQQNIAPDTQVWIGDSMGELFAYYLSADIAFVGGSLVDTGCQNLIEPISCGIPTLFGPSTYHFEQVAANAKLTGAAKQINTASEWATTTIQLLQQTEQREYMAQQALSFIHKHQGASHRMAEAIQNSININ